MFKLNPTPNELQNLLMNRNTIAEHAHRKHSELVNDLQASQIGDSDNKVHMTLPEGLDEARGCSKCPQVQNCMVFRKVRIQTCHH